MCWNGADTLWLLCCEWCQKQRFVYQSPCLLSKLFSWNIFILTEFLLSAMIWGFIHDTAALVRERSSYQIHEIAGCACARNAGNLSPPPQASYPDMHHGTCVTHVPWCMPGSLTSVFIWNRWRGKRSRHSWRMRNPISCVSGKRSMLWHWRSRESLPKPMRKSVDYKSVVLTRHVRYIVHEHLPPWGLWNKQHVFFLKHHYYYLMMALCLYWEAILFV